jgi:four helix bundle protein
MAVRSAKELIVYQEAYTQAMRIFTLSKSFPPEERYALTSQIRRSSRSVCLNLCEAWAKRRYEAHFISKLTDCDGENSETGASIRFSADCGYVEEAELETLLRVNGRVGKLLGAMLKNPGPFLLR